MSPILLLRIFAEQALLLWRKLDAPGAEVEALVIEAPYCGILVEVNESCFTRQFEISIILGLCTFAPDQGNKKRPESRLSPDMKNIFFVYYIQ